MSLSPRCKISPLVDVEQQIVLCAALCKIIDFLPILTLTAVYNKVDDGGVGCITHYRVLLMSASAVMGVQCEQEGAEHAALGGSSDEH